MNMAFFTMRNLFVIVSLVILWHIAAQPLYKVVGGGDASE